ncbi:MAG: SpoIID/LytB domain-containing protein [Lachnospiraceae bacterium]|nr:SpoIID/LytB domain-containing protein [Lachnospiraceae bacterium]
MKKKIKTFLYIAAVMILLPVVVTMLFHQEDFQNKKKTGEALFEGATDKDFSEKEVNEDIEGELVAILAREIAISSNKEAIKAQAVIARTNLVAAKLAGSEPPQGLHTSEMMKLFKEQSFTKCYEYLASCVQETAGEVLVKDKKLIEADYFAVSAGATRNAADAFGKKGAACLQRVESKQDIESEDFLRVEFLEKEKFAKTCMEAYPDADLTADTLMDQIEVKERDESGYVNTMRLGEVTVTGEEFRVAAGLQSACFTIKEVEGQIRIVTKGIGSGVGLSQYGANAMAEEGASYEEILKKYYTGVSIDHYEDYINAAADTDN